MFLGLISLTTSSCKKQTLSKLEGSWALVPIGNPSLLGDDGTVQAGWDVWEFSAGTLSISPEGGAVMYTTNYTVSDVFIESYLIVKDLARLGITISKEDLDKKREFDQYNTKYTIVKITGSRLTLFSQKAGGIQREFIKM